jgi:hypothetical protein
MPAPIIVDHDDWETQLALGEHAVILRDLGLQRLQPLKLLQFR